MALEQFKLDGQVAIVTGAGRGVGEGIAKVLGGGGCDGRRHRAHVVRGCQTIKGSRMRAVKGLALTADALNALTANVWYRPRSTSSAASTSWSTTSVSLDLRTVSHLTDDDFRQTFDYCVTSAFIMSQLAVPHMLQVGRGSIVNISSGAGRFGIRGLTALLGGQGWTRSTHPRHGAGARTQDPR